MYNKLLPCCSVAWVPGDSTDTYLFIKIHYIVPCTINCCLKSFTHLAVQRHGYLKIQQINLIIYSNCLYCSIYNKLLPKKVFPILLFSGMGTWGINQINLINHIKFLKFNRDFLNFILNK